MIRAVLDVRLDLVAEEACGEFAQLELGLKMFLAHAGKENALNGTQILKPAQALEGRTATDGQAPGDVVQAKRFGRGKEKSVNLRDGARQGKDSRSADEQRDSLELKRAQSDPAPEN